jgi:hypothetical protein
LGVTLCGFESRRPHQKIKDLNRVGKRDEGNFTGEYLATYLATICEGHRRVFSVARKSKTVLREYQKPHANRQRLLKPVRRAFNNDPMGQR